MADAITEQDFVSKVLELYSAAGASSDDAAKAAVEKLVSDVKATLADGVQYTDVPKILAILVEQLAALAETGISGGASKKAFVVTAGTLVYELVDKGTSGTENRIDIPYIPNVIEGKIEKVAVPFLLSILVEGIVAGYNAVKK